MNINFASAFQSVQVKSVQAKPHTQTADVATSKHKTVSPERNIKDTYVPSTTDTSVTGKPRASVKLHSFLTDSFKMPKASSPMPNITKDLNQMILEASASSEITGEVKITVADEPKTERHEICGAVNSQTQQVDAAENLDTFIKAENVQFVQFLSPEVVFDFSKPLTDSDKQKLSEIFNNGSWNIDNINNLAIRSSVIHQWERANDFSFSEIPTTPEGKKLYHEMQVKARLDGVEPPGILLSSLNQIEGTNWKIADGAEALVGHEILGMLENGMFANSGETQWNKYGWVNPQINEYGFTIDMPASYNGVSYVMTDLVSPDGTTKKAPILGGDGGQTYAPEIHFRDALGLGGMSLADRKLFLELTQSILDNVMPGMDARQLTYTTGYLTEADLRNNKLSLTLTDVAWLSTAQRNTLEQALNQNRQLFEMKHRADQSSNKGLGEFTMSVLDANGNALAKDQVRLIAGNKSIITSVDSIKNMNQQQIFAFINR